MKDFNIAIAEEYISDIYRSFGNMKIKGLFLQMQHVCQIVLSVYGIRHSYTAIMNLQKYEETTKKLAKWSKEVENQLFKTRMTQGTGLLTVLISLLAALTKLFATSMLRPRILFFISPAMLLVVLGARQYIKKFWLTTQDGRGKEAGVQVPGFSNLADYNLAVQKTEDLLKVMEYLEYSWLLTTCLDILMGQPWAEVK